MLSLCYHYAITTRSHRHAVRAFRFPSVRAFGLFAGWLAGWLAEELRCGVVRYGVECRGNSMFEDHYVDDLNTRKTSA